MRMLKSTDIFPMVQILNKIGFSEIRDIITPEKLTGLLSDDKDQEDSVDLSTILGFNLIFEIATIILKNLTKCKDDLYSFLSDVSEKSVKELEDQTPAEFLQLIIDVLKKPVFGDFFKVVSNFIK